MNRNGRRFAGRLGVALLAGVFVVALGATACGGSKKDELELSKSTKTEGSEERESRKEKREKSDEGSGGGDEQGGEPSGSSTPTGKVVLSSVSKSGSSYEIVLNGVITIKNVRIMDGKNGEFVAFPRRKTDDDWWNYVKVGRGDQEVLLKAMKSEETAKEPKGFEISDVKIKKLSSGKSKAFVEFHLDGGALVLYSWKILDGKKGLWLAPPSEKAGDEWEDVVYASDKEFEEKLEKAAMAAYEKS